MTIGATNQGMVAGRHRQHRVPPPVGGPARDRPRRRLDASARRTGRSRSSPRATRSSRASRRRCPRTARCASSASAAAAAAATSSSRRSSAATASSGCSRTSIHATGRERRPRLVSIVGPAGIRQEPARCGSSRSTSTGSSRRSGGTPAGRRRMATGSRSGRWARWSAAGPASPRPTTRRRPARRSPRRSPDGCPTMPSGGGSRRALLVLLGVDEATADGARRAVRGLAHVLRADRRAGHGRAGVRGPPLGRPGHARLHRPPRRVEPRRPDPRHHARPSRAVRAPAGLGRGPPELRLDRARAAARGGDPRAAARSSSRACRAGPLRAIAERADGIPLYAVETIRMLVAEGRLVPGDGGYAPSGDLTNLAVPETLHALIAARLDALPPTERSLVQDAAVLGQSFTLDALAGGRRPRAAPRSTSSPGARPPRAAGPRRRSAVGRARPVRVRPGADPRGRVRDAGAARPQDAPSRRRPVLRVRRRGRARGRARGALPLGLPRRARRSRQPCRSRPRRGSPSARPPSGPRRSAATPRRWGSCSRRWRSPRTRPRSPTCSSGRGRRRSTRAGWSRPSRCFGTRSGGARRLATGPGAARATALLGQGIVNAWRRAGRDRAPRAGRRRIWRPRRRSGARGDRAPAGASVLVRDGQQAIEFADRAIGRAERIEAVGADRRCPGHEGLLLGFGSRPYEGDGLIEAGVRLAEAHGLNATSSVACSTSACRARPRSACRVRPQSRGVDLAARFGFASTYATALGNAGETAYSLGEWDWALGATTDERSSTSTTAIGR